MNPYGDPQSARARARVPGPSGAPAPDDHQPRPAAADSYRAAAQARATGGAPVPGVGGRASVGAARVGGRASVGQPGGDPYGNGGYGQRPGAGGRTAVARAAVRPGPSGPGYGGFDEPGGVSGPAGRPTGGKPGDRTKAAKRRRRTNILTAAAAVLVILLGAGVVGGTWFFDEVKFETPAPEQQQMVVVGNDGKSVIATRGRNNIQVPYTQINKHVMEAVMAAEDQNFLDHGGIDLKGIARAAWNNFTGGDTQGASTITQQYARHAAELKEISYNRKLREAILARKIESTYQNKQEILGLYLNAIYFGRGANGVEAAAKAYFNKSVMTPVGEKNAITPAEAAVLASVIKQPEPDKLTGHQGFDPDRNLPDAQARWNYTLDNMVKKNWLPKAERDALTYPKVEPIKVGDGNTNEPVSKVMKYVQAELDAMGIDKTEQDMGGLKITTTIDMKVQKAAEAAVDRKNKDSPLNGFAETYRSAVVAVDPQNGRVLAYYGGPDGSGFDYAGPNRDAKGRLTSSGRPPGSTMKVYTLLGALRAGYSFDTTWDGDKEKIDGGEIGNSERKSFRCDKRRCDLRTSTIESYNFPFYWLAQLEKKAVLEAARDAGIKRIGNPDTEKGGVVETAKLTDEQIDRFGPEVGFGQYPVFPLEHANGIATIAADGVYNEAHFVQKVEKRDPATGRFKPYGKGERVKPEPKFTIDVIGALDNVLKQIPGKNDAALRNGRDSIGKTGTWEFDDNPENNASGDAWMVGATRRIASVVWVGNEDDKGKRLPIKRKDGKPMNGGSVPAAIWKTFMDAASEAIDAPNDAFPPNSNDFVNAEKQGNGLPAPPPPPPPAPPAEDPSAADRLRCIVDPNACPPDQNQQGQNPNQNNQGQNQQGQDPNQNGGQDPNQNNGNQNGQQQPDPNQQGQPGGENDRREDNDQGGGNNLSNPG